MNKVEKNQIVEYLKKIILNEGIDYLSDNAYKVYERLENIKVKNGIRTAILSCLLNDVSKLSLKKNVGYDDLYSYIKDNCLLNEKICVDMANIFLEVFSNDNKKEYEDKKEKGFNEFCSYIHKIPLHGHDIWQKDMLYVICNFWGSFSFKVANKNRLKNEISILLKKNPYLDASYFYAKYRDEISHILEDDFEDFCSFNDYYPPDCEEYKDRFEELLNDFCSDHGFELINYEGQGETSDYMYA